MPEFDSRKFGYDNVVINSSAIQIAVQRLLSIFLADNKLQKLYTEGYFQGSWSIVEEIKEEQIIHLLLEIATLYRTEEFKFPNNQYVKNEQNKLIVGRLHEPQNAPAIDLTMKEACNKIIHAETLNFNVNKLPKFERNYLTPKLFIYGTHRKKPWKAILDIILFCEKAMRMEPPNPISELKL